MKLFKRRSSQKKLGRISSNTIFQCSDSLLVLWMNYKKKVNTQRVGKKNLSELCPGSALNERKSSQLPERVRTKIFQCFVSVLWMKFLRIGSWSSKLPKRVRYYMANIFQCSDSFSVQKSNHKEMGRKSFSTLLQLCSQWKKVKPAARKSWNKNHLAFCFSELWMKFERRSCQKELGRKFSSAYQLWLCFSTLNKT